MSKIKHVFSRQILDSRGFPTVEVEVTTDKNYFGRSSIPSGASKGKYEALEIRDNDIDFYMGKSVNKVVNIINDVIFPKIQGLSVFDQFLIDDTMISMDNTENKSNLGANAMLGVSLSVAKAAASSLNIPLFKYLGGINAYLLPTPMINIINGGVHANSGIAFQEFMIIPIGFSSFSDAIRSAVEIFHLLKNVLIKRNLNTSVGDEGGFAPNIESIEQVLDLLIEAIDLSQYKLGTDIVLGLDCASSEFYINNLYDYSIFNKDNCSKKTSNEQVMFLEKLVNNYPIISIEDGVAETDAVGWRLLTDRLGDKIQLVGDDLFVTNINKLMTGVKNNIANAILIKPNQIGTLTETMLTVNKAHSYGYNTILSHRSGETEDTTISDLAVAFNTGQIKTGSVSRSERTCKYNQLIRIEEQLSNAYKFFKNKNFISMKHSSIMKYL
jgi:enolase